MTDFDDRKAELDAEFREATKDANANAAALRFAELDFQKLRAAKLNHPDRGVARVGELQEIARERFDASLQDWASGVLNVADTPGPPPPEALAWWALATDRKLSAALGKRVTEYADASDLHDARPLGEIKSDLEAASKRIGELKAERDEIKERLAAADRAIRAHQGVLPNELMTEYRGELTR